MKSSKYYQIVDAYKYLKHPEKYKGKRPITLRSSYEIKFVFGFLDKRQDIIWWSNESVVIPYFDEVEKRMRRYFPDFLFEAKTKSGNKTFLVEIKPYKETIEPQKKGKNYKSRLETWIRNNCKWNSAKQWCKENGYEFVIITEKELG